MESTVKVKTSDEDMKKLFYKRDTYFIRRTDKFFLDDEYTVTLDHAAEIGSQEGKTFTYQSFIETFDKKYKRMPHMLLEEDIIMAQNGLVEGLPPTIIPEILRVYGSDRCKEKWYVKEVMKSDEIRKTLKKINSKEKNAVISR